MNGLKNNRKRYVFILVGSLLLHLIVSYTQFLRLSIYESSFHVITSGFLLFLNLIILGGLAYFTSKHNGYSYTFWMLITTGTFFYFIGDIIVSYQRIVLKQYETYVEISDLFYLIFLCLFLLAFFYKIMYERTIWEKLFALCDVAIITTSIFIVNDYLLIEMAINQNATSIMSKIIQFIYPIPNLVFLLISFSLLFRPLSFLCKAAASYLSGGLLVYVIVDFLYSYTKYFISFTGAFAIAPLYQVALTMIAISCVFSSKEQCVDESVLNQKVGQKVQLALPYISVSTLCVFILFDQTFSPILIVGLMLTFFFVLVRHLLVRKQNKQLLREQEHFNLKLKQEVDEQTHHLVHQKKQLLHSKQMFKSLYEHHPDPIFTLDLHGNLLRVNNAGLTLLGYKTDELTKQSYDTLIYEEDFPIFKTALWQAAHGHSTSYDVRAYHKNRDIYHLQVTVVPIILHEHISGIYMMVKDVTESKRQEEQINFLAYHDTLTKLANRRAFEEQLEEAIQNAGQNGRSLALMFLDLNRFKLINDTLGHKVGDLLLIAVAERLQQIATPNIKLARLAGDEFTVIVENVEHASHIEQIAHAILQAMDKPLHIEGHTLKITPSIGIAMYPEAGEDSTSLLQHADMAMYDAKSKGKNNFSIYTDALYKKLERKLQLEKDLPLALTNDEFFLVYQPLLCTKINKIIGAEALIRWNHLKLGLISPSEFIPIAEDTATIIPIGKWVLQQACRQLKIWHTLGYTHLKIGVNVSAKEFQQEYFTKSILQTLQNVELDPHYLALEFTERTTMINEKEALIKMRELKAHGISISIDDFGTGYSSLSYLPLFPIDTLKIPRELTQMNRHEKEGKAVVSTILSLAHTLSLSVVAEGVETKEQMQFLHEHGCTYIQGYYVSKPLNGKQMIQFLQNEQSRNT